MAAAPGGAHAAWVMNLLTDLAFNLLIFFVVCASSAQEQKGRPQQVPSTQGEKSAETKPQNVEVAITRTTVSLNGADVPLADLKNKVAALLANKAQARGQDRRGQEREGHPVQHVDSGHGRHRRGGRGGGAAGGSR